MPGPEGKGRVYLGPPPVFSKERIIDQRRKKCTITCLRPSKPRGEIIREPAVNIKLNCGLKDVKKRGREKPSKKTPTEKGKFKERTSFFADSYTRL